LVLALFLLLFISSLFSVTSCTSIYTLSLHDALPIFAQFCSAPYPAEILKTAILTTDECHGGTRISGDGGKKRRENMGRIRCIDGQSGYVLQVGVAVKKILETGMNPCDRTPERRLLTGRGQPKSTRGNHDVVSV